MLCTSCANPVEQSDAKFCPFCGSKLALINDSRIAPTVAKKTPPAPIGERMLVPAWCVKTKRPFLVKFERHGKSWIAASATIISEQRFRNPELHRSEVTGKLRLRSDYGGCPHCLNRSIWFCPSCGGRMSCCHGTDTRATCPWCGSEGELTTKSAGVLHGSSDR
jgi:hypothetical protein